MKGKYLESFEYDINHSPVGITIQTHYELLEEIYRSEQSIVTKIHSKKDQTIYVLKAIKKKAEYSFEREHVKQLNIPGINKLRDSFESDSYVYLIEDFVEGINLDQYVKQKGILEEIEARRIVLEIAYALEKLHQFNASKYVFRDLKPSNIMIKPNGDVVLIDIITIREVKDNQTQDTFLIGSKGYTAPESYGFMQTTERSDIYSLGATLFYMLTSSQPSNITSFAAYFKSDTKIKQYLKDIIVKATAFNPDDRFENVKQFANSIENSKISKPRGRLILSITLSTLLIILFALYRFLNQPFDVEAIKTVEDIQIENLYLIEKGMEFELYDTHIIKITFDRSQLPEEVKAFEYITVGTSGYPYQKEGINAEIYEGLVNGTGFQMYNEAGFNSVLEDRNCLYLALYNAEKEPVAYYYNNDIRKGLEVVVMRKNSEFVEVADGVSFEYHSDYAVFKADQTKVPKFAKVSIWSNPNPFNEGDLAYIQNMISMGEAMQTYTPKGVEVGYGEEKSYVGLYWLVYLLDDESRIIHEYRVEGQATMSTLMQQEDKKVELQDGVYLEVFNTYASIKIDGEKSPDAQKISIWGNENDFSEAELNNIRDMIGNGESLHIYTETGVETGFGSVGTFDGQNWILFIVDEENRILKEYRIDKTE